jgi:hypothetical protein
VVWTTAIGTLANARSRFPDRRLAVSILEAAFVLQVDTRDVERLILLGDLTRSSLHGPNSITVASLEVLIASRITAGMQSLLARWALEQVATRRLRVARVSSTVEDPPSLLDSVPSSAVRNQAGLVP